MFEVLCDVHAVSMIVITVSAGDRNLLGLLVGRRMYMYMYTGSLVGRFIARVFSFPF